MTDSQNQTTIVLSIADLDAANYFNGDPGHVATPASIFSNDAIRAMWTARMSEEHGIDDGDEVDEDEFAAAASESLDHACGAFGSKELDEAGLGAAVGCPLSVLEGFGCGEFYPVAEKDDDGELVVTGVVSGYDGEGYRIVDSLYMVEDDSSEDDGR